MSPRTFRKRARYVVIAIALMSAGALALPRVATLLDPPATATVETPLARATIPLAALKEAARQEAGVGENHHALTIDGHVVWVEISARDRERQLGLMHRPELPRDQGMLFVYPRKRFMSFWMRNTLIPLDIAYLDDDGTIIDILRMVPEPGVSAAALARYPSSRPVRYALELNADWFEQKGVSVGQRVLGLPRPEQVGAR